MIYVLYIKEETGIVDEIPKRPFTSGDEVRQ